MGDGRSHSSRDTDTRLKKDSSKTGLKPGNDDMSLRGMPSQTGLVASQQLQVPSPFQQNPGPANQPTVITPTILDFTTIKLRLANLVDKSFPNPYPTKVSNPEDFDKTLICRPYPPTQIDHLLENSKYNNKSKENQINKFMNYKKETEFYRKYINMNEIKKQKLTQEIEDYKRRQGIYDHMNPNDPQYKQFQMQLRQQEAAIQQEMDELEMLKNQIANEHPDLHPALNESNLNLQNNQYQGYARNDDYNNQSFNRNAPVNAHGGYQEYGRPSQMTGHNVELQHNYQRNDHQNESQDWNQGYEDNVLDTSHQGYGMSPQNNYQNPYHTGSRVSSQQQIDNVSVKDKSMNYGYSAPNQPRNVLPTSMSPIGHQKKDFPSQSYGQPPKQFNSNEPPIDFNQNAFAKQVGNRNQEVPHTQYDNRAPPSQTPQFPQSQAKPTSQKFNPLLKKI
jgi:hypothetical protein